MKTHVIQLAPYDDVPSIRDRLDWAKAGRILLVFPPRTRLLSRTLDLRLLRFHAASVGTQLAIMTRSSDLRSLAREAGLPVFGTVAEAQQEIWQERPRLEKPRRRTESGGTCGIPRPHLRQMHLVTFPSEMDWRARPDLRVVVFALAVLAILTLLLLFLPSAFIHAAALR